MCCLMDRGKEGLYDLSPAPLIRFLPSEYILQHFCSSVNQSGSCWQWSYSSSELEGKCCNIINAGHFGATRFWKVFHKASLQEIVLHSTDCVFMYAKSCSNILFLHATLEHPNSLISLIVIKSWHNFTDIRAISQNNTQFSTLTVNQNNSLVYCIHYAVL